MKGHWTIATPDITNPMKMLGGTYTDAADQDWKVEPGTDLTLRASIASATNMYGLKPGAVMATGNSVENVCSAIDQWVDSWNAGANPAPVAVTDVTAKAGGSAWPVLLLLAFLVFSDGKGKRR